MSHHSNTHMNTGTPDEIRLSVMGRNCPEITTSQHDRRYIMGDERTYLTQNGRGACTSFPDMPTIDCNQVSPLAPDACPELCTQTCDSNSFCDCGGGGCIKITEESVCDDLECSSHSICAGKYLGGQLAPVASACVCSSGYTGPTCDLNPCASRTCSGHGTCTAINDDWRCVCQQGYSVCSVFEFTLITLSLSLIRLEYDTLKHREEIARMIVLLVSKFSIRVLPTHQIQ